MNRFVCGPLFFLLVFFLPGITQGFYEYQEPESSLELRGYIGLGAGQLTYPADNILYDGRDDQAWSGALRLMVDWATRDDLHLSANILQSSRSKTPFAAAVGYPVFPEVERSSLFTWEQHDSGRIRTELVVDDLYLQYQASHFDLVMGRQPINLAATFYFTPNDFFAPFAPQTFFRNYKPGVDGLRADLRLAGLSQLTFLGVLAYDPDGSAANGWSREPDWADTSLLLRFSREMIGFEWAFLFGTVADKTISGGSLQGELGNLVGIRAEGHYSAPQEEGGNSHFKLALGLEKLYANNFSWRLEYFQKGRADSGNISSLTLSPGHNREFAALGLGYEVTPLLNSSFMALTGRSDDSGIISVNFLYSLSDEEELSLLLTVPFGDGSGPDGLGSEFGRQPAIISLEYRKYF